MVNGVQMGLSASAIGNIPQHFHPVVRESEEERINQRFSSYYLRRITVVIPTLISDHRSGDGNITKRDITRSVPSSCKASTESYLV